MLLLLSKSLVEGQGSFSFPSHVSSKDLFYFIGKSKDLSLLKAKK